MNEGMEEIVYLVKNLVGRRFKVREDFEDFIQDGILKFLKSKRYFKREKGRLSTFVFKIVKQELHNRLKEKAEYDRAKIEVARRKGWTEEEPHYSLDDYDFKLDIRNAIDKLPEREKSYILLKFYYDMSDQSISEISSLSRMTVWKIKKSAMKKLKEALKDLK